MKTLSREQILLLHTHLINRYGGIHGVRDEALFDSALNAPFQSFDGYDFYPTVSDKAVRLGYGLVENHPFHDGNKRIGALVLLTTLDLNNIQFEATNQELEQTFIDLAAGTVDYEGFRSWVLAHIYLALSSDL